MVNFIGLCIHLPHICAHVNPTLPRNVELKLKVNSFSIEIENESGVISIYTFDPTSN